MERSKVIIVEGPQGAGKTTLTNRLREVITSTNLIRMSGVKDKTEAGKEKSITVHKQQLIAMNMTNHCDINYVLDRSFLSEFLYANLGFKSYSYTEEELEKDFDTLLKQLNACFDVLLVFLEPSDEVLETRLQRDKAAYHPFSLESSIKQREFLKEIKKMKILKDFNIITYTDETTENIAKSIVERTVD